MEVRAINMALPSRLRETAMGTTKRDTRLSTPYRVSEQVKISGMATALEKYTYYILVKTSGVTTALETDTYHI